MRNSRPCHVILCAALASYAGTARAQEIFDDCGTLVDGTECLLFASDSGGLYLLEEYGSFVSGDAVRVSGDLYSDCVSACLEGDGCVRANTILSCQDVVATCGTLVSRNQCAILEADDGTLYALDQYGGFSVGQRVHVVGDFYAECGGECAQGLACVRNNSIQDASRYCDQPSTDEPAPEAGDEPSPEDTATSDEPNQDDALGGDPDTPAAEEASEPTATGDATTGEPVDSLESGDPTVQPSPVSDPTPAPVGACPGSGAALLTLALLGLIGARPRRLLRQSAK